MTRSLQSTRKQGFQEKTDKHPNLQAESTLGPIQWKSTWTSICPNIMMGNNNRLKPKLGVPWILEVSQLRCSATSLMPFPTLRWPWCLAGVQGRERPPGVRVRPSLQGPHCKALTARPSLQGPHWPGSVWGPHSEAWVCEKPSLGGCEGEQARRQNFTHILYKNSGKTFWN